MAAQFHGKLFYAPRLASAVVLKCSSVLRSVFAKCGRSTLVQRGWRRSSHAVRYLQGVCVSGWWTVEANSYCIRHPVRILPPETFPLVTCSDVQSIVASILLSTLDNCNVILVGLPDVSIRPLQLVLNLATRVVLRNISSTNCATLFIKHWLERLLDSFVSFFSKSPTLNLSRSHLLSASCKWWPCSSANQVENWRTSIFCGVFRLNGNDPTRFKRERKTLAFSKYFLSRFQFLLYFNISLYYVAGRFSRWHTLKSPVLLYS